MAAFWERQMITFIVASLFIYSASADGDRTKKKIYIDLKTQSACFRILNGTHEVGCTSAIDGNVGTVHYVQDDSDFQWILADGPHAPYVAVLNGEDFTGSIAQTLYRSHRVNGIMVINLLHNSTYPLLPTDGFSSVDSCPSDAYGLYSNNSDYNQCQKVVWNPVGTGLHFQDIGIPMFALTIPEDVDNVLNKCYFPFNEPIKNKSRNYPVCSAEVKSRMDGAVDGVTCIRRSNRFTLSFSGTVRYCDPLGDLNVAMTMKDRPHNETRDPNSVILVGARLDSTSLFLNEYRAADTTVAGFVTLLASAEALWKVKDAIQQDEKAKDIMFTFFQGETFDYIGSSRMVYDMNKGVFLGPGDDDDASHLYLRKMNLSHINQFVELNQVGLRDDEGSLWTHTDPLGSSNVSSKVDKMIQELKQFGKELNVSIMDADRTLPLPPASAQWFLKHRLDIPTVVLTDHHKEFSNKFYNSRFDRASYIDATDYPPGANASVMYDYVTTQADRIADLSSSLSHYLFKESTGKDPDVNQSQALMTDRMTITHLLYCFMITQNCELFLQSVSSDNVNSLVTSKQPYSFYVSVDRHNNHVTTLVHNLLARFAGERVDVSQGNCQQPDKDKRYSYVWMQGAKKEGKNTREGWCYQSTTFTSKAISPAWEIDDYDFSSGQYSTWTESVWDDQAIGVRLFLVPSHKFETSVLITGIFMLLVSFVVVYFCNSRSGVIFQRGRRNISNYNPIM